ncbi:hypothetical protein RKD37_003629 [Streptomyces ambofaciens]
MASPSVAAAAAEGGVWGTQATRRVGSAVGGASVARAVVRPRAVVAAGADVVASVAVEVAGGDAGVSVPGPVPRASWSAPAVTAGA